jgi:hypothetical protein
MAKAKHLRWRKENRDIIHGYVGVYVTDLRKYECKQTIGGSMKSTLAYTFLLDSDNC